MVKILTGWSNPGGSTTAFINLTNAFNEFDIECCLYGPHTWHLNKCNAAKISDITLSSDDILIMHFMKFDAKPPVKKFIFSCHEQHIFPLQNVNYKIYDQIHFVSKHQRKFHNLNYPSFIIPNVLDNLKTMTKEIGKWRKVGGVIGSIDRNKQTHISIQKAIEDGCDRILLFGNVTDVPYFNEYVKPYFLSHTNKLWGMGYFEDKQRMWNLITDVYHYSRNETWGYIKAEAQLTNTNFHGKSWEDQEIWSKEKIIENWKKVLGIF